MDGLILGLTLFWRRDDGKRTPGPGSHLGKTRSEDQRRNSTISRIAENRVMTMMDMSIGKKKTCIAR